MCWMLKNKWSQDLIDITLRRMDHDRDGRISFSDFATTVQVQNPGYFHLLGRNLTLYQRKDKYFLSFHSVIIRLINDNLQGTGVKPVSMFWQKSHAWLFLLFCMNSRCYGYTNGNVYNTLFNILKFGSLCNWFVNESSKFVVCVWLVVCFTGEGAPKFFSWLGSILFAGSVLAHCYINHDRS